MNGVGEKVTFAKKKKNSVKKIIIRVCRNLKEILKGGTGMFYESLSPRLATGIPEYLVVRGG